MAQHRWEQGLSHLLGREILGAAKGAGVGDFCREPRGSHHLSPDRSSWMGIPAGQAGTCLPPLGTEQTLILGTQLLNLSLAEVCSPCFWLCQQSGLFAAHDLPLKLQP